MTIDVRYYFYGDNRYTQIAKWVISKDKKLINDVLKIQEQTNSSTKAYKFFYNKLPMQSDDGLQKNLITTFEVDGRNAVTKKLYNKIFKSDLHYADRTRVTPNRKHLNDYF
jgi:hypothetical protein